MRVSLAVILFFCSVSYPLAVTPPDYSKPLTAEQCVQIAYQQSPSLVQARATVTVASAGKQSAWSALVPQVSGQGSYSKTGPITKGYFISSKGQLTPYNGALYSGSLSATQTLFSVGQFAQVAQANKAFEGAKAGEVGARQLLAYNVKQAYYNLVKARKTVEADQTALEQSAEQEKVTAEMKRVGSAALVDLLQVQVQLSQSKTNLLTAQNAEAVARADLCQVMGVDVNTPIEVIEEVTYTAQEPKLEELLAKARKERPDLAQARATLSQYAVAVTAAKGQYLPEVSASAGYSYRDPSFPKSWQYVKDRYTWSTGISLSWTIFDGLIRAANTRTANAERASAEAGLRAAEQAADVDVKSSYLNYTLALDKVKLAEETLGEAEESYRLTDEKYRLGAASTLDLLTSQTTLTQARVQEASTLGDLKIAEAALAKSVGE